MPGFLAWTKRDFAAIQENSNVITALAGIDSENELVVIFAPVPIQSPAGDLIAIAGNMNNDKSEPAFIKINKECIGHSYVIQNHMEIPLAIRPEIPLPTELLRGTSWNEAPKEIGIAAFPTMVPIPFGAVIPEGITPGDEFIEVFGATALSTASGPSSSRIKSSKVNQIMTMSPSTGASWKLEFSGENVTLLARRQQASIP